MGNIRQLINKRIEEERSKLWFSAIRSLPSDTQAKILHDVISSNISDTKASLGINATLLTRPLNALTAGERTTTTDFDPETRDAIYNKSNNLVTSPFAKKIPAELAQWVDFREVQTGDNPRARFVKFIDNACQVALEANDLTRILYWEKIAEILGEVAESHFSDTGAYADRARSTVGITESKMHFRSQLTKAKEYALANVRFEKAAQSQQAAQRDLQELNESIFALTQTSTRLFYNLFKNEGAPQEITYPHLKPSEITSFVIMGLQQVMGVSNISQADYYVDVNNFSLGISTAGENVDQLNASIRALGGKRIVKVTDKIESLALDEKSPDTFNSSSFIANLNNLRAQGRLVINEDGMLNVLAENAENKTDIQLSFPSGFSKEIINNEKLREQAVDNYIQLLTLLQGLKNLYWLNQLYLRYLQNFGKVGAFVILGEEFCKRIESDNKKLAQDFRDKIKDCYTTLEAPFLNSAQAAQVRKGGTRRTNLTKARETFNQTVLTTSSVVVEKAKTLGEKRQEVMDKIQSGDLTYDGDTQAILGQHEAYYNAQNSIGISVKKLNPEQRTDVIKRTAPFDAALKKVMHADEKHTRKASDGDLNNTASEIDSDNSSSTSPRSTSSSDGYRTSPEQSRHNNVTDLKTRTLERKRSGSTGTALALFPPQPATKSKEITIPAIKELSSFIPESKHRDEKTAPVSAVSHPHGNWHFNSDKLKEARKKLGYDQKEIKASEWFKGFFPSYMDAYNPSLQSTFEGKISARNLIANHLKNKMTGFFFWMFNSSREDRNNGRAARLIMCQEMLQCFKDALHSAESLSDDKITGYKLSLTNHFEKQKERFGGTFNTELSKLQQELNALKQNEKLRKVVSLCASLKDSKITSDEKGTESKFAVDMIRIALSDLAKGNKEDFKKIKENATADISNYIYSDKFPIFRELNKVSVELAQLQTSTTDWKKSFASGKENKGFEETLNTTSADLLSRLVKLEELIKSEDPEQLKLFTTIISQYKLDIADLKELYEHESQKQKVVEVKRSSLPAVTQPHTPAPSTLHNFSVVSSSVESKAKPEVKAEKSKEMKDVELVEQVVLTYLIEQLVSNDNLNTVFSGFNKAKEKFARNEVYFDNIADEVSKIEYDNRELPLHDARKVAVLLDLLVIIAAYKKPDSNKAEIYNNQIKSAVKDLMSDLKSNYSKYENPRQYCAVISAIANTTGLYPFRTQINDMELSEYNGKRREYKQFLTGGKKRELENLAQGRLETARKVLLSKAAKESTKKADTLSKTPALPPAAVNFSRRGGL